MRKEPLYTMLQIGRDTARNAVVKRFATDCFNKISFDLQCAVTGRKAGSVWGGIHWKVSWSK